MRDYIRDFHRSRGHDQGDRIECEIPLCPGSVDDVHHINSSYRGKRTHKEDGSDLIGLCREHHDLIHSKNNTRTRGYLSELVKDIINNDISAHIPDSWSEEKEEYFS